MRRINNYHVLQNLLIDKRGAVHLPKFENEHLLDFVSKGLVGILLPTTNYSQFKKAIGSVISGELWFERRKLQDLVSNLNSIIAKKRTLLSKREIEIVRMVCRGYSNMEIMKKLKVTEQSVKSHLNRIYKKTRVSDRLQLAIFAIKTEESYVKSYVIEKE